MFRFYANLFCFLFFPIAAKTLVSGKDNSDGRKNAVSVKQFNAFKKLTTTGTGFKHYELLAFQKAKNYSTARVTRQSLYKCATKAIEKIQVASNITKTSCVCFLKIPLEKLKKLLL